MYDFFDISTGFRITKNLNEASLIKFIYNKSILSITWKIGVSKCFIWKLFHLKMPLFQMEVWLQCDANNHSKLWKLPWFCSVFCKIVSLSILICLTHCMPTSESWNQKWTVKSCKDAHRLFESVTNCKKKKITREKRHSIFYH